MRIVKVFNNNAVLVTDGTEEKVAIGKGIGFNKKKEDMIDPKKIEKLFVKKENEKLQQLLYRIPSDHFIVSEEIISYAEQQFGAILNEHIYIQLTDHISFAIERTENGIFIKNKLLDEIKILYSEEFAIGLWAIDFIKKKLNIELPEDEAAFMALYLHTMKPHGKDLKETIRQTSIIREMIQFIKNQVEIRINDNDLAYQRLVLHLRYALSRANEYEIRTLDEEMIQMIQRKYTLSYRVAQKMASELNKLYGIDWPEQELAYIALHIERLR